MSRREQASISPRFGAGGPTEDGGADRAVDEDEDDEDVACAESFFLSGLVDLNDRASDDIFSRSDRSDVHGLRSGLGAAAGLAHAAYAGYASRRYAGFAGADSGGDADALAESSVGRTRGDGDERADASGPEAVAEAIEAVDGDATQERTSRADDSARCSARDQSPTRHVEEEKEREEEHEEREEEEEEEEEEEFVTSSKRRGRHNSLEDKDVEDTAEGAGKSPDLSQAVEECDGGDGGLAGQQSKCDPEPGVHSRERGRGVINGEGSVGDGESEALKEGGGVDLDARDSEWVVKDHTQVPPSVREEGGIHDEVGKGVQVIVKDLWQGPQAFESGDAADGMAGDDGDEHGRGGGGGHVADPTAWFSSSLKVSEDVGVAACHVTVRPRAMPVTSPLPPVRSQAPLSIARTRAHALARSLSFVCHVI